MDVGCLFIDDPTNPIGALEDTLRALTLQGVRAQAFAWNGAEPIYAALQRAYQRVRGDEGINGIVALGPGCDCAMALACQLPAERLVLLEPVEDLGAGGISGQLQRIRAFARRNAAFCVADALIVPGVHTPDRLINRLARDLAGGRVTVLRTGNELWIKRKQVLNLGIFHFLRDGVLPKSLAENPEMCIIYG